MKKTLLTGLILFSVLVVPTAFAQEIELEDIDLYIQDFSYSKCSESDIQSSLELLGEDAEIIFTADDGSYFDTTSTITEGTQTTASIDRTLCFTYEIGNKGSTSINLDLYYPSLTLHFLTFDLRSIGGPRSFSEHMELSNLDAGTTYIDSRYVQVNINEYAPFDGVCMLLSISIDNYDIFDPFQKISDLNSSNDFSVLCSEITNYNVPVTIQNIRVTAFEGNRLELSWDPVEGADRYELEGVDLAPNANMKRIYRSATENKLVIDLPDDGLYCLTITAVEDDILGPEADAMCYSSAIRLFKDVPITSWYFPYLQNLQANGIISGYKDLKGNELYIFGPSDNLTVAEALKMVFKRIYSPISKYEELEEEGTSANYKSLLSAENAKTIDCMQNKILPAKLQNHWAEKYLRGGSCGELLILKDLENLNPDRHITRAEITNMIFEVITIDKQTGSLIIPHYESYTANDIAKHQNADVIEYSYQKGFIGGYPDGSFKPDALVNRAEITKILYNFKKLWMVYYLGY